MQATELKEYITGMFVAGVYYWFVGNELNASICWDTGVYVLKYVNATQIMVS
jgi:hypothetical protein